MDWDRGVTLEFVTSLPSDPEEGRAVLIELMPPKYSDYDVFDQEEMADVLAFVDHYLRFCKVKSLDPGITPIPDFVPKEAWNERRDILTHVRNDWLWSQVGTPERTGYYLQFPENIRTQIQQTLNQLEDLIPQLDTTDLHKSNIRRVLGRLRMELTKSETSTEYFGALWVLAGKRFGEGGDEFLKVLERVKRLLGLGEGQLFLPSGSKEPAQIEAEASPEQITDQSQADA